LAKVRSWTQGALTGFSQGMMFATYTLAFWYGGKLILDQELTTQEMLTVFMAILFTSMGMGQAAGMMPDASKARAAALSIFNLLDRESAVDPTPEVAAKNGKAPSGGGVIEFREVEFTYPTRKQQKILHGLSFTVKPGQVLALVGESGCGKSTSVGLIERFYEPDNGHVLIDGEELSSLNIVAWRRKIGFVGQEPILFSGTIRQNVLYGIPDEELAKITEDDIVQAIRDANAYDFVMEFPDKLDTDLGEGGAQLSGGQRQRIAIARAIIRKPSILLLDEATSALDSKSEKIVQDALDRAMAGRTAIVIAHRLSTIKHADVICVVAKGRVAETGTHKQLLKRKGLYYKLVKRQTAEG